MFWQSFNETFDRMNMAENVINRKRNPITTKKSVVVRSFESKLIIQLQRVELKSMGFRVSFITHVSLTSVSVIVFFSLWATL